MNFFMKFLHLSQFFDIFFFNPEKLNAVLLLRFYLHKCKSGVTTNVTQT